jgi:hypothetical protein
MLPFIQCHQTRGLALSGGFSNERSSVSLGKGAGACALRIEDTTRMREKMAKLLDLYFISRLHHLNCPPKMRSEHPPHWASLDLAEAEQKLGDLGAAIKILVAAERQGGSDKLLHYRLMHLYSLAGQSDDAKREQAIFQVASQE